MDKNTSIKIVVQVTYIIFCEIHDVTKYFFNLLIRGEQSLICGSFSILVFT